MDMIAGFYAAQPFWVWAGLGAALLAVEIITGSGWLLWASASAGVTALVVALTGADVPTTIMVFAGLTMVSTLLARRYLPQTAGAPGDDINDAVGRLVGRQGVAVQAFQGRQGRVSVDGKEWAAQLEGAEPVAAGAQLEVIEVEGARLTVRAT